MSVKSAREGSKPQPPESNEGASANRLIARTRSCSCLEEELIQEGAAAESDGHPDRDIAIGHCHVRMGVPECAAESEPEYSQHQTDSHSEHREEERHEQSSERLHEGLLEPGRFDCCGWHNHI
jgi:hypothetical protein